MREIKVLVMQTRLVHGAGHVSDAGDNLSQRLQLAVAQGPVMLGHPLGQFTAPLDRGRQEKRATVRFAQRGRNHGRQAGLVKPQNGIPFISCAVERPLQTEPRFDDFPQAEAVRAV